LQGQITVESQVGVGTTFIVRFPRNPVASASAAPLINSSAEAQAVQRLA
jgi:chemotaxis protein histidine kinase CheA